MDDETKERAAAIAEDFGFDLSSVTRAFYRQIVRENRILHLELRRAESGIACCTCGSQENRCAAHLAMPMPRRGSMRSAFEVPTCCVRSTPRSSNVTSSD